MNLLLHGRKHLLLGTYTVTVLQRHFHVAELNVTVSRDEAMDVSELCDDEIGWLIELMQNGRRLETVPYQTAAMVRVAVTNTWYAIRHVRREFLTVDLLFASTYRYRSENILEHPDVLVMFDSFNVMNRAVSLDGENIKYASNDLCDHQPILETAIATYPCALRFASARLRYDAMFCACMGGKYPDCVVYFDLPQYYVHRLATRELEMYWSYFMILARMPGGDGGIRAHVRSYLVDGWSIPRFLTAFISLPQFRQTKKFKL